VDWRLRQRLVSVSLGWRRGLKDDREVARGKCGVHGPVGL